MSKIHCSIHCTHNKGLACPVCYDQTFGAQWKGVLTTQPEQVPLRILSGLSDGVHPQHTTNYIRKVEAPPAPYRHPFLNNETDG